MIHRSTHSGLILLICSFLLVPASVFSQSNVGKIYPPEWKKYHSGESGLDIIQLTSNHEVDCGLYLYNSGFNLKDSILVFASKRTGDMNLFDIDLRTGNIRQLTDGKKIKARGAAYSSATNEVYFGQGREVKALDVHTLRERTLYHIPAGYNIAASLSVNNDGSVIAFALLSKPTPDTKPDLYHSIITTVNTMSGYAHEVTKEDTYISHVVINPVDSTKILYCHEGSWDTVAQRMWYVNQDGTGKIALRKEENPALRVGHEYWFKDGKKVGYQIGKQDKKKYIGVLDITTKDYYEYPFAEDKHTQCNSRGNLFVGDGMPKDPSISLYRIDGNTLKRSVLFRHDSSYSGEDQHPHPVFSPDDKTIFFTTDREGDSNIYIIVLTKGWD